MNVLEVSKHTVFRQKEEVKILLSLCFECFYLPKSIKDEMFVEIVRESCSFYLDKKSLAKKSTDQFTRVTSFTPFTVFSFLIKPFSTFVSRNVTDNVP